MAQSAQSAQSLETVLNRARVIPIQAPEYRQYALISASLDLAYLSIREEAALATNSIKDRTEGLKLQNLALATMTSPVLRSSPEIVTANVQYAIGQVRGLVGSGATIDPSREPIGNCKVFFPRTWQSSDVIFLQSMHFQCCMLLQATRVVPSERQVGTVLGDWISRAKVIPALAPQYRQNALISDFLDLANVSIQEEAALATNWIKDRPHPHPLTFPIVMVFRGSLTSLSMTCLCGLFMSPR